MDDIKRIDDLILGEAIYCDGKNARYSIKGLIADGKLKNVIDLGPKQPRKKGVRSVRYKLTKEQALIVVEALRGNLENKKRGRKLIEEFFNPAPAGPALTAVEQEMMSRIVAIEKTLASHELDLKQLFMFKDKGFKNE